MKFFADNTVTFSGPQRVARAAELIAELPPGAAADLGDGTVKFLRNVVATGWALDAEVPRRRKATTFLHGIGQLVLIVSFLMFGAAIGRGAGVGALPALAMPQAALPLADVTLSGAQIGMAAVVFVVALIGYHFVAGKYIREQAGVKDAPHQTQLIDQPLKVQGVVRFVAQEELDTRLAGYVTSDDLHATELRIDGKIEANFRSLDEKRSRSIGNLHEHLTGTAAKLVEQLGATENRIDERINLLAGTQGELRGELRQINDNVRLLLQRLGGGK